MGHRDTHIELMPSEYAIVDAPDYHHVTVWLGRGQRTTCKIAADVPWVNVIERAERLAATASTGISNRGVTIYAVRGEVGTLRSQYHPRTGWKHVLPADQRPKEK